MNHLLILLPHAKWKIILIPVSTLINCSWLPGVLLEALGDCYGHGGECHSVLAMPAMDTLRETASPVPVG